MPITCDYPGTQGRFPCSLDATEFYRTQYNIFARCERHGFANDEGLAPIDDGLERIPETEYVRLTRWPRSLMPSTSSPATDIACGECSSPARHFYRNTQLPHPFYITRCHAHFIPRAGTPHLQEIAESLYRAATEHPPVVVMPPLPCIDIPVSADVQAALESLGDVGRQLLATADRETLSKLADKMHSGHLGTPRPTVWSRLRRREF